MRKTALITATLASVSISLFTVFALSAQVSTIGDVKK